MLLGMARNIGGRDLLGALRKCSAWGQSGSVHMYVLGVQSTR